MIERSQPQGAGGYAVLDGSISIEYQNTVEDWLELHAQSWWLIRWLRRLPSLAIVVLLLSLLYYVVGGRPPQREVLFPIFAVAMLSSLIRDSEERRFRRSFTTQDRERQRAAISADGFVTGFPPQQALWTWQQVDEIESYDYCLSFTCDAAAEHGETFLIPRRAFRTPPAADAFLALARQYRSAALAEPSLSAPVPAAPRTRSPEG